MKGICFSILLLSASAAGAQAQSAAGGTQAQTTATNSQSSCGLACVVDNGAPAAPAAGTTKLPPNLAKLTEKKSDLNRVVCEKQETLGTRLGTKKVCMTVAQWLEFQNDVKDQTRRLEILGQVSN